MDIIDLTKNLIKISSLTGKEQKLTRFLKKYLEDTKFKVQLQEVVDGRCNILARIGDPSIVFTTHMDTVSPLLPVTEDKRFLYGRGACDAKGSLAAQICATERLAAQGVEDIGLLFLIGEESGSNGARAANALPNQCRYFINGEPTENKLAIGSKGALRLELEATGQSAHSAYPEQGDSAILKLLLILEDLKKLDFPVEQDLGKTTWNIGTINGGTHANVIADQASAELMFRTVTDVATLKSLLEKTISQRAEIQYKFETDPVRLESLDGFDTTIVSFTTDIPILSQWGQPFLFGPGSINDAHSADERVGKEALKKAVDLYMKIALQLKKRV